MKTQLRKIKRYLALLEERRYWGHTRIENIEICPCVYKESHTPPKREDFTPYEWGAVWGTGNDSHAWFHFSFDVTEEMLKTPLRLGIRTDKTGWDGNNPQFIAYINGVTRQGLDTNHTYLTIDDVGHHDCYIYGYTGPRIPETRFYAELYHVHADTDALWYDLKVPFDMLDYLPENSAEYANIVHWLDRAVSMLALYEPGDEDFRASVRAAHTLMTEEFYGKYCTTERGVSPTTVSYIGQTHLDCAWMWTLDQGKEKVQRSAATALELMKRYPNFRFFFTQPYLYRELKNEAPDLYAEIKRRISEGRWECEGAMWVESDCNLPSGESLVRQLIYGKRFFREEFGVESHILWLPDVFGYSAAMPQILRKAGVDWFVTSKIGWNDVNTLPYDTFSWIGIDGTPINTYFLTGQEQTREEPARTSNVNSDIGAKTVSGTWNRYQQKQLSNEVLLTFGYGDGGGGPTVDQLEIARRVECGIPGAPLLKPSSVGDYFARLGETIKDNPALPTWHGELYLEFHRGTYTTVSKVKKNNRRAEFLLGNAELSSVLSRTLFGTPIPQNELHTAWELVLTNQFHDIIPGSSITEVYDRSDRDYQKIFAIGEEIVGKTKQTIAEKYDKNDGYVVFNPHSFAHSGAVKVDGVTSLICGIPAKGYKLVNSFVNTNCVDINLCARAVETERFRVSFDEDWLIISLYDKLADREIIKNGCRGNEIRLYADYPDVYDGWEWQAYSKDSYQVLTAVSDVSVIDDGARRGLRIVRPYKKSCVTQTIWFWDNLAKIDFDTTADWHQLHIMVKAAFPVDIHTDKATYEIQFGNLERPTHTNTGWDAAKFEVCGHKYADLSEGGYGVSLINDCKYGYDIHEGVIQISLFKTPTYPNRVDQGEISFVYSLCPHEGSFAESDTVHLAYDLNNPLTAVPASGTQNLLPTEFSLLSLDCDNVICETIKAAEDGPETVLRLYETKNKRTKVKIKTAIPYERAFLCDLLEHELEELPVKDGEIVCEIKGFEIVTIKLK